MGAKGLLGLRHIGLASIWGPYAGQFQAQAPSGHLDRSVDYTQPKLTASVNLASNQAAIIIVTNPPSLVVVFETHSDLSY